MKTNKLTLIFLTFLILTLTSCNKMAKKEIDDRNAYLQANNITVAPTETGLYYIETEAGTGVEPNDGDMVVVHYTGKFLNGEVFDSSVQRNQPFEFQLGAGQVIKGWDEGIGYMKKGGKATLIIPSDLAYGPNDYHTIPGHSTLVFDVELVNVKP